MVNLTHHWASWSNPHDIIEFPYKPIVRSIDRLRPLYEQGLSLREIAARTGISKTTVRKVLTKHGIILRPKLDRNQIERWRKRGKTATKLPYGFTYFNGVASKCTTEYPVLLEIYGLWKSGLSIHSIVKHLNGNGRRSRRNKDWSWAAVSGIARRFTTGHLIVESDGEISLRSYASARSDL